MHARVMSVAMQAASAASGPRLPKLAHSTAASIRSFSRRTAASNPSTVSILGVPMSYGQPREGTEKAPAALRAAGLIPALQAMGLKVDDRGDVPMIVPAQSDPVSAHGGKYSYAVGKSNERASKIAEDVVRQNSFLLSLGGDHSIAMGTIAGILRASHHTNGKKEHTTHAGQHFKLPPAIVWVDAHADINLPSSSPSGNIHGMPLAFLMALMDVKAIPGCEWLAEVPKLTASQIVYIGLRDVDPTEKNAVKHLGIKAFTMHEVDKYGIGKVMEMALDHVLKTGDRHLHLSYDIDAVDPTVAPATGTRVPGGLNYREAHFVAEACAETNLLRSMDLVEINPNLAEAAGQQSTIALGVELVGSALGKSILT
jgi:arginase